MATGQYRTQQYSPYPVSGRAPYGLPAAAFAPPTSHAKFFSVNTQLPNSPLVVDRSKLPNGKTAADYAHVFSCLPKELEGALRAKGNLEVCLTVDESGKIGPIDGGSKSAPKASYVGAMIKMEADGSYRLAGIWGGMAGGGNNGAAAAMVTSKMMSTKQGQQALASRPVLDAMDFKWGDTVMGNTGSLNRDPFAWSFKDRRPSTFIPLHQGQTYGVHRQSSLGEHHSRTNTWGCLSGSEESFRARMNSRISVMPGSAQRENGLGVQHSPSIAAKVFQDHRDLAANTLGKVYQLNPLMYNSGNAQYADLSRKLNVPAAPSAYAAAQPSSQFNVSKPYVANPSPHIAAVKPKPAAESWRNYLPS